MNIFDTLPVNFFNIFNSGNRAIMSDCLFVLYNYMKDNSAYASLKENIMFELTKYFSSHIVEVNEIDNQPPKTRADYVYKKLRDCGWLVEEQGENYQIYASFEDYAISIMDVLFQLDVEKDVEYSSMVYSIYSSFTSFDVENGHKILDLQFNTTKELINKLKNLNTNIKRYIRRLLKDNIKNNLNQLLDSLLSEYQLKIVDRAFYNLTTRDNPLKYRNTIIDTLNIIRDSENSRDVIVRNIMESKDISYEEAYDIFDEQTLFMIDAFENILDLINEISKKNEKFVASATNRIMFLINVKEDIGGKINEIIKSGQRYDDILDNVVEISVNKILDEESIYSPRKQRKIMPKAILEDLVLSDSIRQEAIGKLQANNKYTQQSIENSILGLLKENTYLDGLKCLDEYNDISLFALTWLYGYSRDAKYEIEPLDELISLNQYRFRNFKIKERKKHE